MLVYYNESRRHHVDTMSILIVLFENESLREYPLSQHQKFPVNSRYHSTTIRIFFNSTQSLQI